MYMHVFLALLLKREKYFCLCIYVLFCKCMEMNLMSFMIVLACVVFCIHVIHLHTCLWALLHIYLFMCYVNWGLSSLLHIMHICREANLASFSSWMYIAYNPLLNDLCLPLHWFLVSDKKGEKNLLVLFLL